MADKIIEGKKILCDACKSKSRFEDEPLIVVHKKGCPLLANLMANSTEV